MGRRTLLLVSIFVMSIRIAACYDPEEFAALEITDAQINQGGGQYTATFELNMWAHWKVTVVKVQDYTVVDDRGVVASGNNIGLVQVPDLKLEAGHNYVIMVKAYTSTPSTGEVQIAREYLYVDG